MQKEIETPVLLACAIEDSTDIFGILGGVWTPQTPPLGTPLVTDDPSEVEHNEVTEMFTEMRSLKSIYWTQVLFLFNTVQGFFIALN